MKNHVLKNQKFKEDVSKRDACMKVFENEDHSFTAAIYDHPVHYMNNGRWEEIDNRLVDGTEEAGDVENAAGEMKIRLSNQAKEKKMVRIGRGEKKLSWGLEGCAGVKRQVMEAALKEAEEAQAAQAAGGRGMDKEEDPGGSEALRKAMGVKHLTSKAVYPGILPGLDMMYTLLPDQFKEDIILKGPEAPHVFTWHYDTGKLHAEQAGEAVHFKDAAGEIIYQLTAPYMADAKGARSSAVKLELVSEGVGTADAADIAPDSAAEIKDRKEALIRLTADEAWFADEERVYPVTIDPILSTSRDYKDIADCHVSSWYKTDNFFQSYILKTGSIDGSTLRSYLKFTLPVLDRSADRVVAARLFLEQFEGEASDTSRRYIDVHRVTGDWTEKTLTWENRPGYDETVIDFATFLATGQTTVSFDITSLVKDWYSGTENQGLLIRDHEEKGNYTHYLSTDSHSDFISLRPHILIQYVNYSGLEPYWTCHSQRVGRAGTVHVNDYNGNLILVHDTLSMTGSRMPVSLSHVFNSNGREKEAAEAEKDLDGYGKGFRLNYHETISETDIDGIHYYKHTDGDGTVHYFRKDGSGAWKDEDGSERSLSIDAASTAARYTIREKGDGKRVFDDGGRLVKVMDANGNTLTVTYSGGKIIKLTDGSGRAVTLTYGTDGRLAKVTDPAGREKRFAYDGSGRLTTVTDWDGAASTYAWNGNGMLTKVSDPFGCSVSYTYSSQPPYRVVKIEERAGTTSGESLSIAYGHNRTVFTDHKERSETYLFNHAGNTVSVCNDRGWGAVCEYSRTKANRLTQMSDLQKTPVQYLKRVTGGKTHWGSYVTESTVAVAEDTGQSFLGNGTIRIRSTALTGSGCAIQDLALVSGKQYVFSAYVKTAVTEQAAGGAVWLQVEDKERRDENQKFVVVARTEDVKPGFEGFQRLQVVFEAPKTSSGKASLRMTAWMGGMKGDVWFDGFQLEEGETAGRVNLIGDNGFNHGLTCYWGVSLGAEDQVVPLSAGGVPEKVTAAPAENGMRIIGDETNGKGIYQSIYTSGKKGDCFVIAGWGKADTVPLDPSASDSERKERHFGLRVNFMSADNKKELHYVEFGADSSEWQYLSAPVVAGQDYVKVEAGFSYWKNANTACFTGLGLYREAFGMSYAYDEKGNVISVTDQAQKSSRFEYDSGSNLKKMLDAKGNAFTYTYDGRHNPLAAKSAANVNYAFTYDTYGNPLTAKVVDPDTPADAKTAMTTKASYTTGAAAGQYMAEQTDALGHSTLYDWDGTKGLLNKVTDAGNNVTAYTYDGTGRITKVSGKANVWGGVGDVDVQYAYEKDRLTKITHNGFDYVFTYDGFGKRTGVSIAGMTAIRHSYGDANGLLTRSTYGNGWEISYTYDSLDRMKSVTAEKDGVSRLVCRYLYDNQGQLAGVIDGQAPERSCTYSYDLTGRLCGAVFDDGTAFKYIYDVNDCLTEEQITTSDGTRTIKRTYDADSREKNFTCGTAKVDVAYDRLGRLSTVKRNGKHTTTYTYQTAPDGGQTGQIAKVTNGSEAITYTYDARGCVTGVVKDGKTHRYQYDALGQLIREEDPVQGKTFAYLYDAGGNMVKKRSYDLTTAESLEGLPHVTKNFHVWQDKLLDVDGVACTSDHVGNLLSDGKYSYTWQNGRQLAGITGEGLNAVYTYDAGGIRTSKTVNGVKTEYLTANGKVLSEKKGSTWQHYLYDGSGNLAAIRYKGADYYYVRDGLMNITGLVDGSGNTVVNYSYDSWGKLLGVTGSMASTLGQENPYRYKGYYYDAETGFYYLESRYYNPEICRFIKADSVVSGAGQSVQGYNLYSYCLNNPVSLSDETGNWPSWTDVKNFIKKSVDYVVQGVVSVIKGPSPSTTRNIVKHYYIRDKLNRNMPLKAPGEEHFNYSKMDESDAKFHQNNLKNNKNNSKYVSADGYREAVYYSDGEINRTPEDMGTFNFCPTLIKGRKMSKGEKIRRIIGHGIHDVIPYMLYGNLPDDSTNIVDRVIMIFK